MANSAQARKRARQADKRHERNVSHRSAMRTAIKKVAAAIADGNKDDATTAFQAAVKAIDSTAGKGLIHANKAARDKSRLNAKVRAM